MSEGAGVPLAIKLSPGQAQEAPYAQPLLDSIGIRRPSARVRQRPEGVAGDKAYSNAHIRQSLPAIATHIKSGKAKALAVSTLTRFPSFPDVPTVAESIPGFNVDSWNAMSVPARTPPEVIKKLEQAVMAVTRQPAVQKALLKQGTTSVGSSALELDKLVKIEIPLWRALTKEANIKID